MGLPPLIQSGSAVVFEIDPAVEVSVVAKLWPLPLL
jgi:hypothetical protein